MPVPASARRSAAHRERNGSITIAENPDTAVLTT
jgi:hypothetical protein